MTLISGPSAFYNEVIPPTGPPPENMDPRAAMAIWQLSISTLILHDVPSGSRIRIYFIIGYLLLFLLTSLGYRAARDALRNDPVSQERIVGGLMTALAIIDVSPHVCVNWLVLTVHRSSSKLSISQGIT
jgi:hypothetical protein